MFHRAGATTKKARLLVSTSQILWLMGSAWLSWMSRGYWKKGDSSGTSVPSHVGLYRWPPAPWIASENTPVTSAAHAEMVLRILYIWHQHSVPVGASKWSSRTAPYRVCYNSITWRLQGCELLWAGPPSAGIGATDGPTEVCKGPAAATCSLSRSHKSRRISEIACWVSATPCGIRNGRTLTDLQWLHSLRISLNDLKCLFMGFLPPEPSCHL